MATVVSELEGILLRDPDPFAYFMLVAFEASGIVRFALLLLIWPVIRTLEALGKRDAALRLMIFLAVAGVHMSEIQSVARAVLPKFYMDDVNMDAWKAFSSYPRRVIVTKTPRVMVERFVKEHLLADEIVGSELAVNMFGYATGFVKDEKSPISGRAVRLLGDGGGGPVIGLGRLLSSYLPPCCQEILYPPYASEESPAEQHLRPLPVIFHDGRLVKRPTPFTALVILLWIPLGAIVAFIRIFIGLLLPLKLMPYMAPFLGGGMIVKGKPPSLPLAGHSGSSGVLFVCTHRTLMDPVVLSTALGRKVPAMTYSISRFSEILSPIPTVRLSRNRDVDAEMIKRQLEKGDLVVCPEGTTCREPFLLRFSALFAELTDKIVPVAMNYRVGFFHATTARGWKGLDPIFLFMNPRPIYEITFLNQLPAEVTCSGGKSPYDVANYVQRILAATLGFECTNLTRKDKYKILAGNDGTASYTSVGDQLKRVVCIFKPFIK
ncbi:hypothetical protein SAY86_023742 [Trapa natans]|uniref:Phospholipid/glycerol acyltransferase domain-containing protein n=1 Tax=Trapa natans TaxID=22666 RepID=A0AAN7R859_TRANT|nr:hypothetical protein SAY86_023742 [Trapa natans]